MLIVDDQRRCVGVNRAMCLLLRLDRETVLKMRVDDLTPPELHGEMRRLWDEFMRDGVQSGTVELRMPDVRRMRVGYSATANVAPGRHLSLLVVPPTEADVTLGRPETRQLSAREREVLALIATGESGPAIARALNISPSTVESHVRNCLAKLEARNRAHAIALALQLGEIPIALESSN